VSVKSERSWTSSGKMADFLDGGGDSSRVPRSAG
jgi:hypothetical protein